MNAFKFASLPTTGKNESNSEAKRYIFEWKIKDFILRCTGPELRSPVVKNLEESSLPTLLSAIWQIKLVPNAEQGRHLNFRSAFMGQQSVASRSNVNLSYYVKLALLGAPPCWVTYTIKVTNKKCNTQSHASNSQGQISTLHFCTSTVVADQFHAVSQRTQDGSDIVLSSTSAELVTPNQEFGPQGSLITADQVSNFLDPDGSLTITCEIKSIPANSEQDMPKVVVPNYDITSKLKVALQNKQFSDVTLVVGAKEFKAHRVILTACSPVFATMFQAAALQSRFIINDVQPVTFQEMLTYIYTGEAPNIKQGDMTTQLFFVADKYQLEHLKALCEKALSATLTTNNVGQLLYWANNCHGDQLKRICLRHISLNWKDFVRIPGWAEIKQNTELASEIIELISSQEA